MKENLEPGLELIFCFIDACPILKIKLIPKLILEILLTYYVEVIWPCQPYQPTVTRYAGAVCIAFDIK